MTKRQLKALDNQIEKAYYRQGHGVQISIMDIGKIFSECRAAVLAGGDLDAAIGTAIAKYRKN
jgi:hypothetical protein